MFRRRRPLARAAVVGGVAYHAGKKTQEGREREYDQEARIEELEAQQSAAPAAPAAAPGGMTDAKIEQLQKLGQLKEQGILTDEEFNAQKQKLLNS
jgi:BMFP domain-containing protein YqiC